MNADRPTNGGDRGDGDRVTGAPGGLPDGKSFAFTILDDTDVATVEYIRPIYNTLTELGFRTTKTVWPLSFAGESSYAGSHTLEHEEHAAYIRELKQRGFEIAFHGARQESSRREDTVRALELFRELLGAYPRTYAAHALNRENLYWGVHRVRTPVLRAAYRVMLGGDTPRFEGHLSGSEFFWGDVALSHIDYVRSFTFRGIDQRAVLDQVIYSDGHSPWVNNFFITADAEHVEDFTRLLRTGNQDRLERSGGICIVSTHLGKGFVRDGAIRSDVRDCLEELSSRNGWFVPVCDLLDHLVRLDPPTDLSPFRRAGLELRWLADLVVRRMMRRGYDQTEIEYLARAQAE